jgi:anti-sigma regulatory factor (Ser/Thr protein kinase)
MDSQGVERRLSWYRPNNAAMTGDFRARFPNTRRAAAFARRSLISHIAAYGYPDGDLADIETAVGEALANAAEHGHRVESGFEVRVYVKRDCIVIEVQDEGTGFLTPVASPQPACDAPRGFGIYLMRHLMDEVDFDERGTCVRLTKRLPIARQQGANFG